MIAPHFTLLALGTLCTLGTSGAAAQDAPTPAPVATELPAAQPIDYEAWSKEEVGLGVWCSRKRFPKLFGHPQSLQILELDPAQKGLRVRVAAKGGFFRTSELARSRGAIAAVNGGFFSRTAEPVGLLSIDGKQLSPPHPEMLAALRIGTDGRVSIEHDEGPFAAKVRDALAARPLLVQEGKIAVPMDPERAGERHPRTAAGITKQGRIFFVTVDGRSPGNAAGMTFAELAQLFVELGCETALNLDGGGSTTMWVRGAGDSGIVNHPCDNFTFDAAGERRVANCILIHSRDVLVLEEDAVTPPPAKSGPLAAMQILAAGDASGGHWLRVPAGITVGIDCPLDFPGAWELWARIPAAATPPQISWNPAMLESRTLARALRPDGSWQRLGEVRLDEPGLLRIHFSGKQPFGVDALRLVER